MNRLKLIILLLIAVLLILIYVDQFSIKTIDPLINIDLNKTTKIDITSGSGITETITDRSLINDVYAYLSKLKFEKAQNRLSSGWSYALNLYEGKKDILTITFIGEDRCIFNVNGDWYKIIKSTDATVESLFNKTKNH